MAAISERSNATFGRAHVACLVGDIPRATGTFTLSGASIVTMVQAANLTECDYIALGDALHAAGRWRIFRQREMGARSVTVRNIAGQDSAQMLLPSTTMWFRQSRLIEPISLSAYGFCQGLEGADRTSAIPIPATL